MKRKLIHTRYLKSKDPDGFKNYLDLETYQLTISIQTKKLHDKIEITVTDNCKGITQKIVDKIF